jgi:hypothetical protein
MPDEHTLILVQTDQARADFAAITDELQFIKAELARLPCRFIRGAAMIGADRASQSDCDHYRDMAAKLRELASGFRFAGARQEILRLAASYERRADHLDRRAIRVR